MTYPFDMCAVCEAYFGELITFDEEETLARLYFPNDGPDVPVNISLADVSDVDLREGETCEVRLWSDEYVDLAVCSDEEEYLRTDPKMAPVSMIPMGTFSIDPEQTDFQQNAMIYFTGIVKEAWSFPELQEDDPTQRLRIETFALTFDLFYYGDEPVEPGSIVQATVWLYGRVNRRGPDGTA